MPTAIVILESFEIAGRYAYGNASEFNTKLFNQYEVTK